MAVDDEVLKDVLGVAGGASDQAWCENMSVHTSGKHSYAHGMMCAWTWEFLEGMLIGCTSAEMVRAS